MRSQLDTKLSFDIPNMSNDKQKGKNVHNKLLKVSNTVEKVIIYPQRRELTWHTLSPKRDTVLLKVSDQLSSRFSQEKAPSRLDYYHSLESGLCSSTKFMPLVELSWTADNQA